MGRKGFTLVLLLLATGVCHAQFGRERQAVKHLQKQQWEKARQQLLKAGERDPVSIPAHVVWTRLYLSREYQRYHIDSAHRHIDRAMALWSDADGRLRDRVRNFPVDSMTILSLAARVDSLAFAAARRAGSEEAYIAFLSDYGDSGFHDEAAALRDEAAFARASSENTYQAFQSFFEKYPAARQVPAARSRYELLLYEARTRDRKVESYASFLKAHPASPYAASADSNVYQLTTAPGTPEAFREFLAAWPASVCRTRGRDILFHLLAEDNRLKEFPASELTDSLRAAAARRGEFLVPFFRNNKYGFMTPQGREIIPAEVTEIPEDYFCGNISDDVLLLGDKLMTPGGRTLIGGGVAEVEDLGYGYLLVSLEQGKRLLHKSGVYAVPGAVDDARVLSGQLLATRTGGAWVLFTFAGRRIVTPEATDVFAVGDAIVLRTEEGFIMITIGQLVNRVRGEEALFTSPFDEVRTMPGNRLWVRKGELQGVYDDGLSPVAELARQQVTVAFFGLISRLDSGYHTYNRFGEASENFRELDVREPWVSALTSSGWVLYDPVNRMYKSIAYDSLSVFGPFAVGVKKDGFEINFFGRPGKTLTLLAANRVLFIPGHDTISFLGIENEKKLAVYNREGSLVMTIPPQERMQYAGSGHFIFFKGDKKGLMDSKGKIVLPAEYDAVGNAGEGMISLLRASRFGIYLPARKSLIKPEYQKNIGRYARGVLVGYKAGGHVFLDESNKPLGTKTFSEVRHWTDSVALVREGNLWSLHNVFSGEPVVKDLTGFTPIRDRGEDRLYIFTRQNQNGVYSSKTGEVLPMRYSDIVNVGSQEHPVYFTEKHVQEASLYVVIYYDERGAMLRKEVYEQDDYEKIYCNQ